MVKRQQCVLLFCCLDAAFVYQMHDIPHFDMRAFLGREICLGVVIVYFIRKIAVGIGLFVINLSKYHSRLTIKLKKLQMIKK